MTVENNKPVIVGSSVPEGAIECPKELLSPVKEGGFTEDSSLYSI